MRASGGPAPAIPSRSPALRIAAVYLLVAALWIVFSDRVLGVVVRDPDLLVRYSLVKGLAFVLVTAGVLRVLMQRALSVAEARATEARRERLLSDAVIDSLPGVLYIYDETGRFLRWNRRVEQLSGRTAAQIATMHPLDFFPAEERPHLEAGIAALFADGDGQIEASLLARDGTTIPHLFTGRRLQDGDVPRLVGVGIDISDRIAAEQALRRLNETLEEKTVQLEAANRSLEADIAERHRVEQALRASRARSEEQARLLDQTQDAVLVHDLDGTVRYWNWAAERIYGHPAAAAVGQPAADLLGADAAQAGVALAALLEHGGWSGEMRQHHRDGTPLLVEARWTLLRTDGGVPRSVLVVGTDVTERRRVQAQLVRAQRFESIGTLAGGLAHDLNNLLSPIVIGVGMLRRDIHDEGLRSVIDAMEVSARRGTDLVKQVLSFSRGTTGERVVVDLAAVIADVVAILTPTLAAGTRMDLQVDPGLPAVLGDPSQLTQVVMNLCVNARAAMPGGGTLGLRATSALLDDTQAAAQPHLHAGTYVRLQVTDDGVGMSPAVVDRAFEPFFTTKTLAEGTGLGLSTALGIVQGHGGAVDVRSAPGEGSTFTVHLPVLVEDGPPDVGVADRQAVPRGDGERVLVVDDEASICHITARSLEAWGYRTLTAADGAEALQVHALHGEDIAVVMTDMMMPVVDGATLVARLRERTPGVRVITTSALTTINGGRPELAVPGVPFIAKPYATEDLLRLLRAVIEGPAPG